MRWARTTAVLALGGLLAVAGSSCSAAPPTSSTSASPSHPATMPATLPATLPEGTDITATAAPPRYGTVKLVYLALSTPGSGPPGCAVAAVAVTSAPLAFTDEVAAAMTALLSDHRADRADGLRNPLATAGLALAGVERTAARITVRLQGTLGRGGACDAPRLKAQLQDTAEANAHGTPVLIEVNGEPLDSALSGG